jgi:HPt (histidine-containing phosphotransfer) domain-containing protein
MENNKVTNLATLNQLTGGDKVKKEKYIRMFLDLLPKQLNATSTALADNDLTKLRSAVHTLKSQLGYMGVKKGQELAQQIERMADEKTQLEDLPAWVENFIHVCNQAHEELIAELSA